MRRSRHVLLELISGVAILGVATVVFMAAQQTSAVPVRSVDATAKPEAQSSRALTYPPVSELANASPSVGAAPLAGGTAAQSMQGPADFSQAKDAVPAETPSASAIPRCDRAGGMGLSRIVQIDTTGGPEFGFQHLHGYDFLRDKEVVLTFDDGPWPGSTAAVLRALRDQCLKATFFEIGEHASWHPEITREVIEAGMTVGTHTWSHKDLARNPYAGDLERAEQEIELGNSAVHMAAAGGSIAPFFRFPDLQQTPQQLKYLAQRNVAIFSTDIDSRDFAMHKPEQVIKSVMKQLERRGKGIILLHDFHRNTAAALPELLNQLKNGGYKVVHMVPKAQLITISNYDAMLKDHKKLSANNLRPENNVVSTVAR
jgi:peptidoglycan/xylan/chitin deacetylase (PgdA/CDA1 family)